MSATLYEIAEQALSKQPEEYAEWMERCSDPLSVRRMDYERWTPTQREIVRKHLQEACLESESIDLVVSMLHGFDRRMCVVSICGLFSRLLPSLKGQGEKESREALEMYEEAMMSLERRDDRLGIQHTKELIRPVFAMNSIMMLTGSNMYKTTPIRACSRSSTRSLISSSVTTSQTT